MVMVMLIGRMSTVLTSKSYVVQVSVLKAMTYRILVMLIIVSSMISELKKNSLAYDEMNRSHAYKMLLFYEIRCLRNLSVGFRARSIIIFGFNETNSHTT